jgi:hypothetical protein
LIYVKRDGGVVTEEQIHNVGYVTTLIATVSIDKLTSFIESKGGSSELKGSLFSYNLKIKDLAKESELKAFKNLKSIYEKQLGSSFDFDVSIASEPKMISESLVSIRIKINSNFNKNIENFTTSFLKTLRALSLDLNNVAEYQSLNIPTYGFYISPCVSFEKNKKGKTKKKDCEQLFFFRNKETSNEIIDLLDIEKYVSNYKINNEVSTISGTTLFNYARQIYKKLPLSKLYDYSGKVLNANSFSTNDIVSKEYYLEFKSDEISFFSGRPDRNNINLSKTPTSQYQDELTYHLNKEDASSARQWIISSSFNSYKMKYGIDFKGDETLPYIIDFEPLKENKTVFTILFEDSISKDDLNKIKNYTINKNQ